LLGGRDNTRKGENPVKLHQHRKGRKERAKGRRKKKGGAGHPRRKEPRFFVQGLDRTEEDKGKTL